MKNSFSNISPSVLVSCQEPKTGTRKKKTIEAMIKIAFKLGIPAREVILKFPIQMPSTPNPIVAPAIIYDVNKKSESEYEINI